ncbi:MAG: [protein-PII] uridylyltransferase [Burkholderiales bacterium]|nr:[protein-PII] uridylyltransferase [Burkholderiales bacterium]
MSALVGSEAATSAGEEDAPADLRQSLKQGRESLRASYRDRPAPRQALRAHCRLVDRILVQAWRDLPAPCGATLIAVGGYGRGELFPYSDVDLLILVESEAAAERNKPIEDLIGMLWDIGLEVGHSVRSVKQCVDLAAHDITVQTNLLEARRLTGDAELYGSFAAAFAAALDPRSFCKAKQLEQRQRHERFVDTNLEPNLKEFPGGLRDLHHLVWIARAARLGRGWTQLVHAELVTAKEASRLAHLQRFLSDLRIRLHYQAGRREDRLLFDYQSAIACELGLEDTASRRASEQLMQTLYRTATAVRQLNAIVHQNVGARIFPQRTEAPEPINERFCIRNELLEATREDLFEREPAAILESFQLLQEHHELKGMRAGTLRALWRAGPRIDAAFRQDPSNRERFMSILRSPSRLLRELRRMNEYGILGRYIPAFGRIVGQMQHDLYHVYTVDEHIFKVVRNLRRFAVPELSHEYPLCSRLISDFERPELLYLAGLFHDIAKGRGGDHSMLGAVDARRFCRRHGLPDEDVELVAWLVRHHLTMSASAQKQDISDPETIASFAALVTDDRHLVALYLLTVADIRGTSPRVWNAWKAKLLEDLFWATRRVLSGEHIATEASVENRQAEALTRLRLYAIPADAHEKLWAQLDTSYFLRHEAQEIAWHTRLLNYRVQGPAPVVKARLAPMGEGLQVLIYTPDQKELFARICNFFSRAGFSIVEAKIHTTRHGYALDSFLILDPQGRDANYRDVMSFVEHELSARLQQRAPLEPPGTGRLSRRVRHFPMTPEVDLQPDERGTYMVLTLISSDRPGLLYRIARVLVAHDISVHSAKINTLGERVEDTFLITGPALNDASTVVRLESELTEAVQID